MKQSRAMSLVESLTNVAVGYGIAVITQMHQIESEFGLTPSSRSRIRVAEPAEKADPFEDFLSRGRKK